MHIRFPAYMKTSRSIYFQGAPEPLLANKIDQRIMEVWNEYEENIPDFCLSTQAE